MWQTSQTLHVIDIYNIYVHVWQIVTIERIISACDAQTMKECLWAVKSLTISLSIKLISFDQWAIYKWFLCRFVENCAYSFHTCTEFAWVNEKFQSVVNDKLIVQRFELNALKNAFLFWELSQSNWEKLKISASFLTYLTYILKIAHLTLCILSLYYVFLKV